MVHLVIDIGNSRTKFAVFHRRKLTESGKTEKLGTLQLKRLLDDHNITHSIISSVNEEINTLEEHLKKRTNYITLSAILKAGIINK